MEANKLKWCFKIKDGLKIAGPNENLSGLYLKEAKSSLLRADKNFHEGDLLWTTVVIYYAEYYSLYSFLQRIGVKCKNHFCSILAVTMLLGKDKTKTIYEHKEKRIDAQYYMRTGKKEQVEKMLQEAKLFVAMFDEIVSNLSREEIDSYRKTLGKYNPQIKGRQKLLKEKSCGAVLFRKEKGRILYLLLHYEAGHWDFPKGNQEKGEQEKDTVIREIEEETGIKDTKILDGFNHQIKYRYRGKKGELIDKQVSYYIAETSTKEVKLSFEHIGFEWLDYEKAMEKLTFNNAKELLKKANHFFTSES